jgi:hypothetical protein
MNLCKTEQFCSDLKKLLIKESVLTGKDESHAKKNREYDIAFRCKEHMGTIAWLLLEMDNYAQKGEWL